MPAFYADFWLNGGVLTLLDAWAFKDAEIAMLEALSLESFPMDDWLALSEEEERMYCQAWGDFTPPVYTQTGKARRPGPAPAPQITDVQIAEAIAEAGGGYGSITHAAKTLGVSRQLLHRRRREAAAD